MAVSTTITLGHRLEALGWGAYLRFFGAMPIETASRRCAGLMCAIGPLTSAHTTAIRNLARRHPPRHVGRHRPRRRRISAPA
jgi:hypothetical protein